MLIIDDREPRDLQAKCKDILGEDNVQVQRILVADYLIFDKCGHVCAIERKHVADLLASITRQKLRRQVGNLDQYDRKVLLVEGSWHMLPSGRIQIGQRVSGWAAATVAMIVLGLQEATGTSLVWVFSKDELVQVINALVKQGGRGCFLKGARHD